MWTSATADEAIVAPLERQLALFDQAPGFIAILRGPDHVFEWVNQAYTRLLGGRPLVGLAVREAAPEIEGQGFLELLDQVYRSGERYVAHHVSVRLQGGAGEPLAERFLDFIYEPMRNERGEIEGIFCEGHDVTQHHLAQAELQATQRRQEALIELSDRFRDLEDPADISFTAAEVLGQTLAVSRAGYGTIDRARETIFIERDWNAPGIKSLAGLLHFRDYGSYIEDLKRGETVVFADAEKDPRTVDRADALKAISAQAVVNMPVTEHGGFVALLYLNHATARPWTDEELAFIREVAERTRTAVERRRAEQELRALAASLERQVAERTEALRQSQKLESMGQLTGGVAHDFNNLLTPIIGSLDMLQRRGLGGPREQRLLEAALASAERAKTLVQRLLAFARRQPLQPTSVDVGALMNGMAELVASTTGPQIKVTFEVEADLPAARADPNQLEMAILNLSVNARDAMPDGGTLKISASKASVGEGHRSGLSPGTYVRLAVADTGVGMDEAVAARAVEPFFSTKGVGKGTGLGLSMVHGLALQLGGALCLSSRPGDGATIELWLPLSEEAPRAADEAALVGPISPGVGTVLLVDDEAFVRMSTAEMLTELGYGVVEAGSAEEALEILSRREIDLLVTDHLMPGMTGVELARAARDVRPETPVILISGFAETEGVAVDLPRLTKPFRQAELASIIATVRS